MQHDAVVLGAGPAGLGAALALVRGGSRVAVVEASDRVGGLCVTLRRDGVAYDLGGHILFVHDERRRAWLAEILGDDLVWVDRPVVCVRGGGLRRGRYLDQRPDAAATADGSGPSARDYLAGRFGAGFVDSVMRQYLEKVDGMPLERILAARARKLLVEQYAPEGFWYAAGGIGQLMDAMAAEIRRRGGDLLLGTRVSRIVVDRGRVTGVEAHAGGEPVQLASPRIIAGLPPALVAGLADPPAPQSAFSTLPARAAAIVYLELARDTLTEQPWIQIDDPRVPFARMFEAKNWSPSLVPGRRTVLGCECYCSPTGDDPAWGLDDRALGQACAWALADPLGLVADPAEARLREVVRLPHAWSLVDVDRVGEAAAPGRWLEGIEGLEVAQGGDVVLAIAAGEAAAGGR